MSNEIMNPLVVEVKSIIDAAKAKVAKTVNNELIISYWKIGEIIIRYEQNGMGITLNIKLLSNRIKFHFLIQLLVIVYLKRYFGICFFE